jgi:glutathione peroxidase
MSIFDFELTYLDGKPLDWAGFKGKKILLVNTASKCGLTPQYQDLEELYEVYKKENFVVIGVPSNDFAGQEPGTSEEIATFCSSTYGVTFPMTEKISVKSENRHPLYQYLIETTNDEVSWNFHKFLINEKGEVVKSLGAQTLPFSEEIVNWIMS